jgi:D-alanyl-D-alanine carboxypeptidase
LSWRGECLAQVWNLVREMFVVKSLIKGWGLLVLASISIAATAQAAALPTPFLVADADTGKLLIANEPTAAWYPAELTELMTVYVALDAVRAGKLTMDTPLIISALRRRCSLPTWVSALARR